MNATCSIYEPQMTIAGARTCGAAALCMVYRSLGRECSQEEVWARLSAGGRTRGGLRTHRLAADALSQGLAALVMQATAPWQLLQTCFAAGVEVILNQRLAIDSPWGHYTVLDRIDAETAWVHDPQFGPGRPIPKAELLQLWQGFHGRSEICGNVAIVISDPPDPVNGGCKSTCCPHCQQTILLHPTAALDCGRGSCRSWSRLHCPSCDWSISAI